MQAANRRRWIAYPVSAVLVGGLIWAGWIRQVDAGPGTLLACASARIQLAHGVSLDAPGGKKLREELIAQASDYVARARKVARDHPSVLVAEADLAVLRGDKDSALASYALVQNSSESSVEARGLVGRRRVEILAELGHTADAFELLRELERDGLSGSEMERLRLEAVVHRAAGDVAGTASVAERLAKLGGIDATLEAGELFERLGASERAAAIYSESALPSWLAEYRQARLKLMQGELDTAMVRLNLAWTQDQLEVANLLRQERALWSACNQHEVFARIVNFEVAAPVR